MAEKVTRYMDEKLKQKDAIIEKLRLKNATLKSQIQKVDAQLKQKEEMGTPSPPPPFRARLRRVPLVVAAHTSSARGRALATQQRHWLRRQSHHWQRQRWQKQPRWSGSVDISSAGRSSSAGGRNAGKCNACSSAGRSSSAGSCSNAGGSCCCRAAACKRAPRVLVRYGAAAIAAER